MTSYISATFECLFSAGRPLLAWFMKHCFPAMNPSLRFDPAPTSSTSTAPFYAPATITHILTLVESVLNNLAEESLIAARPDLGSSTSTTTKNPPLGNVQTEGSTTPLKCLLRQTCPATPSTKPSTTCSTCAPLWPGPNQNWRLPS